MVRAKKSILKDLGINTKDVDKSFNILTTALSGINSKKNSKNLKETLKWSKIPNSNKLKNLEPEKISYLVSRIKKKGKINKKNIRKCQIQVQGLIPDKRRKEKAAYFTEDEGTNFMGELTKKFLKYKEKEGITLSDPFLGSGLTLTHVVKKINSKKIKRVWGIEPLPLSALVAFAALYQFLEAEKINVRVGDAFKIISKYNLSLNQKKSFSADIVLTNPPFTRWRVLDKEYRKNLLKIIEGLGYKNYITRKSSNLQVLSMFLIDSILKKEGLLISVLPASTFYTTYGEGVKTLLKGNYSLMSLIESNDSAFSKDSGFKEIILSATKGPSTDKTLFTNIKETDPKRIMNYYFYKTNKKGLEEELNFVDLRDLPNFLDNNWLALFNQNGLRKIITDTISSQKDKKTLESWQDVFSKKKIIRGLEMYGTNFFFIPNKYWKIKEKTKDEITIKKDDEKLSIKKKYLTRTLRKPSIYSKRIKIDVGHYMFSIPEKKKEKLPKDLREYIEWGISSDTANSAINAFGDFWYSHVFNQISSKKPFSRLFLPDKVDILFKNRSVFCNYTSKKLAASKNFYLAKLDDKKDYKTLAAWFNSTLFLAFLMLSGRKISDSWTRLLIRDYLDLPVINLKKISKESKDKICKKFDQMSDKILPPLWEQLGKKYRKELDKSIMNAIGGKTLKNKTSDLYDAIQKEIKKVKKAKD